MNLILRLTGLAALCGLLIVATRTVSEPNIQANRMEFAAEQRLDMLNDPSLEVKQLQGDVYEIYKANQLIGHVFPVVTNDGYNGEIDLWLASTLEQQVLGVRVTYHQETPGLGDKLEIAVSDWILSFNDKTLNETRWDVAKHRGDFDQFTGATITPRAVIHAVRDGLEAYPELREEWEDGR